MIRTVFTFVTSVFLSLPAWAAVEIEEVTSPGGITAWLVEDHSIPFVALDIRFQGGTSLDAPDQRGVTYLMTGLLEEGAGPWNDREFAEAREGLAAGLTFTAYRDTIAVGAQMLTQNREDAVAMLRAALVEPRFDSQPLERVRGQVISIIESNGQDPESLARDNFRAMAHGDHPYASAEEGTVESVAALTRDDIVAAHRAAIARDRIFVGAAGDITAEELGLLLDDLLGDLPATGAPMPEEAPFDLGGGTTVVDFPTPQSVVFFGHEGIERTDPDFFPAFVLNQIIGGGNFRSRLMEEVRIERGLTYGIYTFLALSDHRPLYLGQFSSSNDLVAQAIDVVQDQWADIAANGVSEEELESAILFLTGAYPLRFDGNDAIASIMAGMQQDGMPIDYIATRNAQVEAVTMDNIRRVAARLLQPEGLHFVVVGQPDGIEASN